MEHKRTVLGAAVLVAAVVFASPALARAQSAASLWTPPGLELLGRKDPERRGSVVLRAKATTLKGDVEPLLDLEYDDLFKSGFGLGVEGSLLWLRSDWYLGGYLAIGWETYGGKSATDDIGDTLEADDLGVVTVMAGFKALRSLGSGFHGEANLGIGAVRYLETGGTLTLSGTPIDVDLFPASTVFAFDVGVRVGYSVGRFTADLGLGVRLQGAPDTGDLDLDVSSPSVGYLELGVGITF
jgi:hypothetical protein